jgi:peptidoglycan/LPS O-acetylase OafA/YrhL
VSQATQNDQLLPEGMSTYIDVWRFAAAMVIFLGHASSKMITDGLFWQLALYLQSSVIVFFVLSGFVIAYAVSISSGGLKEYTVSRVSRLESVVIPALLLTAICDYIGILTNGNFYYNGPWGYQQNGQLLNYFLSLFLLQNIWDIGLNPGINSPFWSLTFEAFYYALFGCAVYLRGYRRTVLVATLILLGGPTILALLPVWGLGVLVFQSLKRVKSVNAKYTNTILCGVSVLSLALFIVFSPKIRAIQFDPVPYIGRPNLVADYFDGITFSIHLLTASALLRHIGSTLLRWRAQIIFLASLTFALYLFHRPLIQLAAALSPYAAGHWVTRVLVIVGTFLFVVTVGRWVEGQRSGLRKWMLAKL